MLGITIASCPSAVAEHRLSRSAAGEAIMERSSQTQASIDITHVVLCAGAMIKTHSPCVCFILQMQGHLTASDPKAIANANGGRAEVLLRHGSVALVVGSAVAAKSGTAVAATSGTKHPELMETPYTAKDWTCKRGAVDVVIVHFDFGWNPRGAGRRRR